MMPLVFFVSVILKPYFSQSSLALFAVEKKFRSLRLGRVRLIFFISKRLPKTFMNDFWHF